MNQGKPNAQIFSEYLDLIGASKSPKWYYETKRLLKDFFDFLGEFPPTVELFTKFFHGYSGLAPSTRARYYFVFSAFFNWYNGQKIPFKIKSPKLVPQIVPDSEVGVIQEAIEKKKTHKKLIERDRVLVLTAKHTGLRRAELADLIVADLHIGGSRPYLHVRHGKGNKQRDVPLNSEILPILRDFVRGKRPEESVFGLSAKTISMKFWQWSKRGGVGIHTHSLRHKFATDILNRGGNIRAVQKLLGHESLATTEVYLGVTDESLRDAVGLLTGSQDPDAEAGINDASNVGARILIARKHLDLDLDGLSLEKYMSGPVEHDRYSHKPFLLETESNHLFIHSVEIRTSEPSVAYRLMIFERLPGEDDEWTNFDLAAMEEVDKLAHIWSLSAPLEYTNTKGDKGVCVALITSWRPMRFDIDGDELLNYFKQPIHFDLKLTYTRS